MLPFSTEFPVKPIDGRGVFVAAVVAWLRGTSYSTVLDADVQAELDSENAVLQSANGEELRLREIVRNEFIEVIGFRHDFPDNDGRLWRTEVVLRKGVSGNGQDFLRVRTQCLARRAGAFIEIPRKPYLIKALLRDGWGGLDGLLDVCDVPRWLQDTDDDLSLARSITFGGASRRLPIVYVSATAERNWAISKDQIEKLAYDLGGIAHVVVEPDRAFSFQLRDRTSGANAYGGAIGLILPEQGILRRFVAGWRLQDAGELAAAVRRAVTKARIQMPAIGWGWAELQEQALRVHRERERARLTEEEIEALYIEEINNLKEKIKQLEEERVNISVVEALGRDDGDFSIENLVTVLGPEIYIGEISDRLRIAARETLSFSDHIGLDSRSKVILERFVERIPVSPGLNELLHDLSRASRTPKKVAANVTSLLRRHGYREKSDNKHIRLEADHGYEGLGAITLPKTPSEHRGLMNLVKQIERTLGISKLSE